jgi:hypothetical protein
MTSSSSADQGITQKQSIDDQKSPTENSGPAPSVPAAWEAPTPSLVPAAPEPPWLHSADAWQSQASSRRIDVAQPARETSNDAAPVTLQPPPAGHRRPESSNRAKIILIGVGVLVLLGTGGVLGFALNKSDSIRTGSASAGETTEPAAVPSSNTLSDPSSFTSSSQLPSTSEPISPMTSSSPTSEADAQGQAKYELAQLAAEGKRNVTLDSRWVAQLSSKWIGITDPLQISASGSHTFQATDILAEHRGLKSADNLGAEVFMLRNIDFGAGARPDKRLLWITVADGGFSSRDQVEQWCASRFPNLHGKRLKNNCLPNRLRPLRD